MDKQTNKKEAKSCNTKYCRDCKDGDWEVFCPNGSLNDKNECDNWQPKATKQENKEKCGEIRATLEDVVTIPNVKGTILKISQGDWVMLRSSIRGNYEEIARRINNPVDWLRLIDERIEKFTIALGKNKDDIECARILNVLVNLRKSGGLDK